MSDFPENSLTTIFRLPGCRLIYSLHVPVTLELLARGFSFVLSDPEPSRQARTETNKQTNNKNPWLIKHNHRLMLARDLAPRVFSK